MAGSVTETPGEQRMRKTAGRLSLFTCIVRSTRASRRRCSNAFSSVYQAMPSELTATPHRLSGLMRTSPNANSPPSVCTMDLVRPTTDVVSESLASVHMYVAQFSSSADAHDATKHCVGVARKTHHSTNARDWLSPLLRRPGCLLTSKVRLTSPTSSPPSERTAAPLANASHLAAAEQLAAEGVRQ
jgi:hypothetical protein